MASVAFVKLPPNYFSYWALMDWAPMDLVLELRTVIISTIPVPFLTTLYTARSRKSSDVRRLRFRLIGDLRRRLWSSKSLGSRIVSRERFEEISSTMKLALAHLTTADGTNPSLLLLFDSISDLHTVSDRKRKRRKDGQR